MFEHLNLSPLLGRLRVYDREFQALLVQADELNHRIAESEGKRAALESQIAHTEHQLSEAVVREEGLTRQIAEAAVRAEELTRQIAAAQNELHAEAWAAK